MIFRQPLQEGALSTLQLLYLPLGLLPQAGVSLGLVLAAKDLFVDPKVAELLVNVILASVIVNELVSPALVKFALIKAGEAELD